MEEFIILLQAPQKQVQDLLEAQVPTITTHTLLMLPLTSVWVLKWECRRLVGNTISQLRTFPP